MTARLIEFPNTNLQDVPAHMQKLCDKIARDGDIQSAIVILRTTEGDGKVHLFGSVDGLNAPIIQLECAKAQMVNNILGKP